MEDLTENPIRHFYLFAKGAYLRTYINGNLVPMISDCATILERIFDIKVDNADPVFDVLLPEATKYIVGTKDYISLFKLVRKLLNNLNKNWEITVMGYDEALIQALLAVLATREAVEVWIGDPDPAILPVSSPAKLYGKKREKRKNEIL